MTHFASLGVPLDAPDWRSARGPISKFFIFSIPSVTNNITFNWWKRSEMHCQTMSSQHHPSTHSTENLSILAILLALQLSSKYLLLITWWIIWCTSSKGDHLRWVYHPVFSRPLRPTQPGHPSLCRRNEYRPHFRPQLGKKQRVLHSSGPCDQDWWRILAYCMLA